MLKYLLTTPVLAFTSCIISLCLIACSDPDENLDSVTDDYGFKLLFNERNFDEWYLKVRSYDADLAKKVFTVESGGVHIFNDHFPDEYELGKGDKKSQGILFTRKSYSKYILRFEYKWGTRIAHNFKTWQYDSGVFYHVTDDSIWPKGMEYQIRYNHLKKRNHTGDLHRSGSAGYDWYSVKDGDTYQHPEDGGQLATSDNWAYLASPTDDFHALDDGWNQCEIIVMGDKYTIHKLNGKVVNMAFNLKTSEGVIGFQAETAEIYYRNIEIKEFDTFVPADELMKNFQ